MSELDLTPNLWRVGGTALVIALAANVLLVSVSADDDAFANVIGVASAVAGATLLGSAMVAGSERVGELRAWALLLAFAVWTANLIEFAFEADAAWQSRVRQCGFYLAFAVLALGGYVGQALETRARARAV